MKVSADGTALAAVTDFVAQYYSELAPNTELHTIGLEIELRLGQIFSSVTQRRQYFNTLVPLTFRALPKNVFFKSGVTAETFNYLRSELEPGVERVQRSDAVYMYNRTRKIVVGDTTTYQTKRQLDVRTIHLPTHPFDLRVSISREQEVPPPANIAAAPYNTVRFRDRTSIACRDFVLDFTAVRPRETSGTAATIYEVEGELRTVPHDTAATINRMLLHLLRTCPEDSI